MIDGYFLATTMGTSGGHSSFGMPYASPNQFEGRQRFMAAPGCTCVCAWEPFSKTSLPRHSHQSASLV